MYSINQVESPSRLLPIQIKGGDPEGLDGLDWGLASIY